MADIDLAPLAARSLDPADHIIVVKEGAPGTEEMGKVLASDVANATHTGDVTGSGALTIAPGAVSLSKMADLASSTILGRATAGTGAPEALTAAQVRGVLNVADGATANASDAALRDRATHTGTQLASTISNFGSSTRAVALDGFAAAGSRVAVLATDTILAAFGKVQKWLNDLSALAFSGSADDLTGTKTSAFISDFASAVSAASPGTDLTYTAATRVLASSTGVDATLPLVTSTDAGLAPASGGGTDNFLRADGTWAPAGGGGGTPLATWDWWEHYMLAKTGTAVSNIWTSLALGGGTNNTALPASRPIFAPGGVFIRSTATANAGYRYNATPQPVNQFGTVSQKYRMQFLWRTSFVGRVGLFGWSNEIWTNVNPNFLLAFYQGGDLVYGKCKNVGTSSVTSNYTLSLDVAYTFEIDVNAAGTSAQFRIYADQAATPVFDETLTVGIPSWNTGAARFIVTEGSTTASDIGILYSLGIGTVEGFEKWRGIA